jgi:hypothetical protein
MVGRGSGKTEKWSQGKMTVRRSIAGIAGELLRVFILARRLLNGCGQFWSIVWGPWVGFKMGVFQSPDLRIAEAKDLIDL